MIISASYKTDIPAFYGEWFMNRLSAGFCKLLNPYNQTASRVSLVREDVDGIVFWTKNVGPFLKNLGEVHNRGYPFVIQHTINGYPRALEQAVIDPKRSIENLKTVAGTYGNRSCVWRYDTIIDSSLTPRNFHVDTFGRLAASLEGVVDEVVISFAHLYNKTKRNMEVAAKEHDFTWVDPSVDWKVGMTKELSAIAQPFGIQLTVCSQPAFTGGCAEARCIDSLRMSDVAGKSVGGKIKGNRKECGCFMSKDIGDYDTCPHGCVYCYAVQNKEIAKSRYRLHDPLAETLFPLPPGTKEREEPQELLLF